MFLIAKLFSQKILICRYLIFDIFQWHLPYAMFFLSGTPERESTASFTIVLLEPFLLETSPER